MSVFSAVLNVRVRLLCCVIVLVPLSLSAETLTDYQSCLLRRLESAAPSLSVAELKLLCDTDPVVQSSDQQPPQSTEESEDLAPDSLIGNRLDAEKATRSNPFVLLPHKQNYALLASYNAEPNYQVYSNSDSEFDRWEIKFQLSFKMPVMEGLFGTDADLYAAYTNLSFWQAYNQEISSPFRETNHEPELFVEVPDMWPSDWELHGWRNALMRLGVVHQSNGQGGYRSRSWNRMYANFVFEKKNILVGFKPWYRIPEDNDDNPDIDDFLGRYEIQGLYKNRDQTFSLMLRNLFDGDSRDTLQLDWSFPLYGRWRGYLQYFYGYGESLIDYNAKSNRLGFGLQLTDWL